MCSLLRFFRELSPFNDSDFIFLNKDGSILAWNGERMAASGLPREQVIGRNYSTLFTSNAEDQKFYLDLLMEAEKKGVLRKEVTVKGADGSIYRTKIKIGSIRDHQGKVIGYTVTPPQNTGNQ